MCALTNIFETRQKSFSSFASHNNPILQSFVDSEPTTAVTMKLWTLAIILLTFVPLILGLPRDGLCIVTGDRCMDSGCESTGGFCWNRGPYLNACRCYSGRGPSGEKYVLIIVLVLVPTTQYF